MAKDTPFKDVQVLLVDDEDFVRGVMMQLLWEFRVQHVTQCKNGEEALTVLRDHPQSVDLILLDMQMPKKNGLQVIREVQEVLGPPASEIPIVVISGIKEPDLIKALAIRGIRNFLLKPVSKADLGARMAAALGIDLKSEGGNEKSPWLR